MHTIDASSIPGEYKMSFHLSDTDKFIIVAIAATLILATVLVTICIVSPWCYLYKWFSKSKLVKNSKIAYPSLNPQNPESRHFHLSIVPVYGSKNSLKNPNNCQVDTNNSPTSEKPLIEKLNQFENLANLAEKTRLKYSLNKKAASISTNSIDNDSATPINFPKVEAIIYYKLISESTIQICCRIKRVFDISSKELWTEPSPYVVAILSGYRIHGKNITIKGTQNELFRTETMKRCCEAIFNDQEFISEELPRNLIKEASIKLRLMNEERYANDVCMAEFSIPLKKVKCIDYMNENGKSSTKTMPNITITSTNENLAFDSLNNEKGPPFKANIYTMFPIKEVKGELLAGFCYLPTSRRINITIVKGNIKSSLLRMNSSTDRQAFYVKALLFYNGKLIKKKKTPLSIRLAWGTNETISFDLPDEEPMKNLSIMLILAFKMQNSNSPESPLTPDNNALPSMNDNTVDDAVENGIDNNQTTKTANSNSISAKNSFKHQKESFIGHFILDRKTWLEDILKKPRKQILKWYKLN